jgi:hypothetical protein
MVTIRICSKVEKSKNISPKGIAPINASPFKLINFDAEN